MDQPKLDDVLRFEIAQQVRIADFLADLDFSDGPIRVDVPMTLSIDAQNLEAIARYLYELADGREERWTTSAGYTDVARDVLYPGWRKEIAVNNDVSDAWEKELPDDAPSEADLIKAGRRMLKQSGEQPAREGGDAPRS